MALLESIRGPADVKALSAENLPQLAQEIRDEFEKLGKPLDNATRTLANFGDGLTDMKKAAVFSVGW